MICFGLALTSISASASTESYSQSRTERLVDLAYRIDGNISRMVSEQSRTTPALESFCKFFNEYPKVSRQDEISILIFMRTGFCTIEPVAHEHASLLADLISENFAESVVKLPNLHIQTYIQRRLEKSFPLAADIQEFARKVADVFPVLHAHIGRSLKLVLFARKVKEFKTSFANADRVWVDIVADLTEIMRELGVIHEEVRLESHALLPLAFTTTPAPL